MRCGRVQRAILVGEVERGSFLSIEVSKVVTSIQTDVPTVWGFERNGLQLQPGRA